MQPTLDIGLSRRRLRAKKGFEHERLNQHSHDELSTNISPKIVCACQPTMDEDKIVQLGARRTDGRGVSVTFFNSHWRLFISTSCKEHLRIFVSSHFFNVSGDVAAQWRTELVTWVLGAVAKPIETRVPKLLEKEQCDRPSSVQGTLTCPTPPHPLPHILQAAEHQQRVQRTRNVNMPHPTPPTDPRGRSINLVPKPWKWLTNGERHTAVYAACANYTCFLKWTVQACYASQGQCYPSCSDWYSQFPLSSCRGPKWSHCCKQSSFSWGDICIYIFWP